MQLSDQEKERRETEIFLKKSNFDYYDLSFTEEHQNVCEQYLSGQLTDQEFDKEFYKINRNQ